jgi:hypothetical protein
MLPLSVRQGRHLRRCLLALSSQTRPPESRVYDVFYLLLQKQKLAQRYVPNGYFPLVIKKASVMMLSSCPLGAVTCLGSHAPHHVTLFLRYQKWRDEPTTTQDHRARRPRPRRHDTVTFFISTARANPFDPHTEMSQIELYSLLSKGENS